MDTIKLIVANYPTDRTAAANEFAKLGTVGFGKLGALDFAKIGSVDLLTLFFALPAILLLVGIAIMFSDTTTVLHYAVGGMNILGALVILDVLRVAKRLQREKVEKSATPA